MKKFNQTIKIEVSVDAIANQLEKSFAKEFPHSALLTEAIIGSALDKSTISHIYNALNGYDVGIDFKNGDVVYSKDTKYNGTGYDEIGVVTVLEVNQYASSNVKVTYMDKDKEKQQWVRHTELRALTEAEQNIVNASNAMSAATPEGDSTLVS